jgi:hypothetical protein
MRSRSHGLGLAATGAAVITAALVAAPIGPMAAGAAADRPWAADAASCGSVNSVSASPDTIYDQTLDTYGNYTKTSPPQWTGGDGAFSVGVSSGPAAGQDYWFFGDTFNGPVNTSVNPPTRARGSLFYARDSMVPQLTNGLFTTTAFAASAGPDGGHYYIPAADGSDVYWPGSGFTQTVSGVQRIREFFYRTNISSGGTDTAVTVATIDPVTEAAGTSAIVYSYPLSSATDAIFFGGSVVNASDGYRYIYGGQWNHPGTSIQPFVARVAASADVTRLANWQFFEGFNSSGGANWGTTTGSTPPASVLVPLSGPFGNVLPVTSNYSVTQVSGKYVMMTMDGSSGGNSLTHIVYYWACTPYGPWYGPGTWSSSGTTYYEPPEVRANNPCVAAYFPQFHPEHTTSGGQHLLSYSLNEVHPVPSGCDPYLIDDNVNTYRPGFVDLVFSTS